VLDGYFEENKRRGGRLNNIVKELLFSNGLEETNFESNDVQIVCKDVVNRIIGIIYIKGKTDTNCRMFKFDFDKGREVFAYDYDSLLTYVDFIDKKSDYSYTGYTYPLEEIQDRVKKCSKHYTTIEFKTDYSIFDKILSEITNQKDYILERQ
jgi:hypothetical protein